MSLDDCLDVEAGVFEPSVSIDYHLAIRRALLPDPERLLQMVVLPSFEPEFAVYVVGRDPRRGSRGAPPLRTVVVGRVTTQLWGAAMERSMGPPGARGPRIAHTLTEETFRAPSPEVDWARAPLGDRAYQGVGAVWMAALAAARARERRTVILDGTRYHFSAHQRSGMAHSPLPGTVLVELVALGTGLGDLARPATEDTRRSREEALTAEADRLLARIRALP